MEKDETGKIILPMMESLCFFGAQDPFLPLLTESEASPLAALEQFVSELPEADPEDLEEFIRERHYFREPDALLAGCRTGDALKVWLETPVLVNVGLTVDSFSEYTINTTYPAYDSYEYDAEFKGLFHQSSLMWLTRRQGYSQRQLRIALHAVKNDSDSIDSPYLLSAAMEVWHEMSEYNQLGFFLRLPMREFLFLRSLQRWGKENGKWPGYVCVGTDTVCGLFSTQNGSTSLLNIKLEKPVKLPLNVLEILPDGARGFSIGGVYGNDPEKNDSIWKNGCVLHWGLPRQARRNAVSWGYDRLAELP